MESILHCKSKHSVGFGEVSRCSNNAMQQLNEKHEIMTNAIRYKVSRLLVAFHSSLLACLLGCLQQQQQLQQQVSIDLESLCVCV